MNTNVYDGIAEGDPVSIMIFLILAVGFICMWAKGFDMGTHEDTGRPVKSLNTREGKRAGQRRRYHENK